MLLRLQRHVEIDALYSLVLAFIVIQLTGEGGAVHWATSPSVS